MKRSAFAIALAAWCLETVCFGAEGVKNLLESRFVWRANVDRAGARIKLSRQPDAMRAEIKADGGREDYPKLRLRFPQPQDWRKYSRMRISVRLTSRDPRVRRKQFALVFYDERTRIPNYYPGRPLEKQPMKQQSLAHTVPVNQWVEIKDWLDGINRSAIRQLDIYLYERGPAAAHEYGWEFRRIELERVGGSRVVFDGEVFSREEIKGRKGEPAASVRTRDGLELSLGSAGEVCRVACRAGLMGAASPAAPAGLLVRDAAAGTPPALVGGRVFVDGQKVRQVADVPELGLAVEATYASRGEYLEIRGKVTDKQARGRALTVYVALPLRAGPWRWWDSVSKFRRASEATNELSYVERGVAYGQGGAHSKYPLGAVTLPGRFGLSLAVRMDEPVVHRIVYNARLQLFYVALDFGLVPERTRDGRSLSEAPFRVLVFQHNPAWGFRSALQRYYDFFPQFFTKRVRAEGGWYVWGNMAKTPHALEAGFRFHWGPHGADAVKWDNQHGTLALFYIESETYQQTMEDYTQPPGFQDAYTRLKKLAAGDRDELRKVAAQPYRVYPLPQTSEPITDRIKRTAQCVMRSLSYNVDGLPYCGIGKRGWMRKSRWGAIFACNLCPNIPRGKGWFNLQEIIEPALRSMEKHGAHYDGIALDSFGGYGQLSRVNYRRGHFRYSTFPLSFSASEHRPAQVAFFETVAWLRQLALRMHSRGKVLMANCSWGATPGWLCFAAPYLDIFGAEHYKFADPDFIRAIAWKKSCTDLPYKPRPESELAQHFVHAIFPGHGNKIDALRRYAPALQKLAAAGWRPITQARVEPQSLRIERFGQAQPTYLVLWNPTAHAQAAAVTLDPGLSEKAEAAMLLFSPGGTLQTARGKINVQLGPNQAAVIVLGK